MSLYWVWTAHGRERCASRLYLGSTILARVERARTGYYWLISLTWWDQQGLPRPTHDLFGRAATHQAAQRDARRAVLRLLSQKSEKARLRAQRARL